MKIYNKAQEQVLAYCNRFICYYKIEMSF